MRQQLAALSVVLAALATPLYATTLTGNGGFEVAGGGGATDSDLWEEFAGGLPGTLSERDSTNPASGSWAHHIVAIGDVTAGASAGITQNTITDVGLPSLQEGTAVTASFDADLFLGVAGVAFGEFSVLNGDGSIVATTGPVALADTLPGYEPYTLPPLLVPAFGPGPNSVYAAFLNINVAAGAVDGSLADAFVDNVEVIGELIPEPTTAALAGVVAFGLVTRRRR